MLLTSMLVSAETCFLYFSELSLTPLRHALTSFYVCSTCAMRYFLFYKCCYLFQTHTEYLLFFCSQCCSFSKRMWTIKDKRLNIDAFTIIETASMKSVVRPIRLYKYYIMCN